MTIFTQATELEQKDKPDDALDLIYATIDELLCKRRYQTVNDLLNTINVQNHSTIILLAALTTTLTAKRFLPSRNELFIKIQEELMSRGEYNNSILKGLD